MAGNACSASWGGNRYLSPLSRLVDERIAIVRDLPQSQRYLRVHPEDDHEGARVALLQNLVEEVEPQLDDECLKLKARSLAVFLQAAPKRPTFRRVGHSPCPSIVILI